MKEIFKFKSNISEQEFMESILNMTSSGDDVNIILIVYALGSRMHINDFNYYFNLINKVKKTSKTPQVQEKGK